MPNSNVDSTQTCEKISLRNWSKFRAPIIIFTELAQRQAKTELSRERKMGEEDERKDKGVLHTRV